MMLDDEERRWVADIVNKAFKVSPDDLSRFIDRIEYSIEVFRDSSSRRRTTHRKAHDAMRELYFKVHDDRCGPVHYNKCRPDEIRSLVDALPDQAINHIDRRAKDVIPKLFPGETADQGFRQWVKTAKRKQLIAAMQVLSSEGAALVDRSRGPGKRSRMRPEPVIMGVARGGGGSKDEGGRLRDDRLEALVRNLAIDWSLLTGKQPITGRSDISPFGDLVHSVLQWEHIEKKRVEHALRRYLASREERETPEDKEYWGKVWDRLPEGWSE